MSTTDLEVVRLLDAAKERLGSDYKLAKVLGVPQQQVSEWRTGKRTCVAADRALLAGLAGEDAVQELIRATLSKYEGTTRGEKLRQLMGNALPRIGGAAVSVLLALGSLTCWPTSSHAQPSATRYDVHYVESDPEAAGAPLAQSPSVEGKVSPLLKGNCHHGRFTPAC